MIIVPFGSDCGVSECLKKYNLRSFSFPFDWVVAYNGIAKCIDEDFKNFIPKLNERINDYDIYFHHDFTPDTFNNDEAKYKRRILRLQNILEHSEEEVVFLRKGHPPHHHDEHNGQYTVIKSDLEDAEYLDAVLSNRYKNLKYKIIVTLVCGKCFDKDITYVTHSDRIEVHNTTTPSYDDERFEQCVRSIFKV
jgi:hypothetical protein